MCEWVQILHYPEHTTSVSAAPSASTVPNSSGNAAAAATTTTAVDMDVNTTHGSDDLMDDEVEALERLAYGDDDDDDDDSGYDGNVQYPYHPQPQSKIQYDSDDDSVEDFEFSQQVNYN